MRPGREFFCEYKRIKITVGILDEGTEICPYSLINCVVDYESSHCSYVHTFQHLTSEQMKQLSIQQLAALLRT